MIKQDWAVSVVIPVYNVRDYLDACVQSVLAQTLPNIEIILVNDGSTDDSGTLCDFYADTYDNIRVIHKENGGLSSARNAGVQVAKSDLVGFVDSDDTILPEMYQNLYEALHQSKADVAFGGMLDVYANRTSPAYQVLEGIFETTAAEAIKFVLEARIASVSAVNKLYRKDLLLLHPFLEGKTSEDAHFIIPYLHDCQKVVLDLRPVYCYFHREGTITTKPFKESDLSIIEAYTNNRKLVASYYPEAVIAAEFRFFWSHFYVLDKLLKSDKQHLVIKKEIIGILRQEYKNIINNPLVGRGRKIAMTGLLFSEKIYKFCLEAYNRKYRQLH